jgi:predicted CXXCH cytochrome family protein
MKKAIALLAAAGVIAAATASFGASIVNSKHDLSKGSLVGGVSASYSMGQSTQICIYCHAPHNAQSSLPLWNRTNPPGTGFVLYSGVGMANVSFKTGFTSDSTSLFCMSCHDGVTGIGAVYNAGVIDGTGTSTPHPAGAANTFTNGANPMAAGLSGNLTTNLSKTHPINFPVSVLDSQSDLWVVGAPTGKMGKTGFEMPLFKSTAADANRTTANRSLECGSCHAVHDSQFKPFLRYTMGKSALCLGCHNK